MELANSVAQQIHEKELSDSCNESPVFSPSTGRAIPPFVLQKALEHVEMVSSRSDDLHFEQGNMTADLEVGASRQARKGSKFNTIGASQEDESEPTIRPEVFQSADRLIAQNEFLDLPKPEVGLRQSKESSSLGIQKSDLPRVHKSRTFDETLKDLTRMTSTAYDKQRSLQQKRTTVESYFGSIDAPGEVGVNLLQDQEAQFEHKKLVGVRTYSIGLQLLHLLFNIRMAMTLEDSYSRGLTFSFMLAWVYVTYALAKSSRDSIEWVYSSILVLALRSVIQLIGEPREDQDQLGVIISLSLLIIALNCLNFISSLRMKYKWAIVGLLSLIGITGGLRQIFPMEMEFDIKISVFLLIYIPAFIYLGAVPLKYQNLVSSIAFWQTVTSNYYNSELELIVDNLELAVVLIDEEESRLNYFNECSQDKFSRALPFKKRFSSAATDESQYFNRICNLKLFEDYLLAEDEHQLTLVAGEKTTSRDANDASSKLSLKDILKMDTEARDSKIFRVRVYDSQFNNPINSSSEDDSCKKNSQARDEDDFVDMLLEQQNQVPTLQYLQIKKKEYRVEGKAKTLVQLIDVTRAVLYDRERAKSKLQADINATVLKEMRNPLSSVESTCAELGRLAKDFDDLIAKMKESSSAGLTENDSDFTNQMIDLKYSIEKNKQIQSYTAKNLLSYLNSASDFGATQSGSFEKKERQFDLSQAVREVVETHSLEAQSRGIEVAVDYQNFGDDDTRTISSDQQRFSEVLSCLLSNALKFTLRGHVMIKLRLVQDEEAHRWTLITSVRDTGLGMSLVEKTRLFRPFGTLSSTKDLNSSGSGLGLFMSKSIVEQFSGQIQVSSIRGKGSLFSFSMQLPADFIPRAHCKVEPYSFEGEANEEGLCAAVRDESEDSHEDSIESAESFESLSVNMLQLFPEECMGQQRILVVDDFQFNIDAITIMLKVAGINRECQVHTAMNGSEAIKQATYQNYGLHYTLIFMDINMPVVDGYQAAKRIKEVCRLKNTPAPKIFAITGHVEEQYIKLALDSGMEEGFQKPVQLDQIQKALSLSQPNRKDDVLNIDMCRRISRYRRSRKQTMKKRSAFAS